MRRILFYALIFSGLCWIISYSKADWNKRVLSRSLVGRGRGGTAPPLFSTVGTRPPLPHFFGLKFMQKLVHCCNWLLTETQCNIIFQYSRINTSSCIAGQDQRSAVAIFVTCMSVRVCGPKLFKNLCLSLVSFLGLGPTPLVLRCF